MHVSNIHSQKYNKRKIHTTATQIHLNLMSEQISTFNERNKYNDFELYLYQYVRQSEDPPTKFGKPHSTQGQLVTCAPC